MIRQVPCSVNLGWGGVSPTLTRRARCVTDRNCVAARRGGEQQEVKNQAVGYELDSALTDWRACAWDAKPDGRDLYRSSHLGAERGGITLEASPEPWQARRRGRTAMWLETAWFEAGVREGGRPGARGDGAGSQSVRSSVEAPVMGVERRARRKEEA